ncbi:MAG: hypothetical protein QM765_17535 [Myxococcales bacterium]
MVSVSAKDTATGKRQSITVTASGGLTQDELARIMEEQRDYLLEAQVDEELRKKRSEVQSQNLAGGGAAPEDQGAGRRQDPGRGGRQQGGEGAAHLARRGGRAGAAVPGGRGRRAGQDPLRPGGGGEPARHIGSQPGTRADRVRPNHGGRPHQGTGPGGPSTQALGGPARGGGHLGGSAQDGPDEPAGRRGPR